MTDEAVKRYDESSGYGGVIQDYTVADTIGIEKGTLLMLTDPRTASGSITVGYPLAGIAAREKIANDGRTQLALYKKGYFDMRASGAIGIGNPVMAAGHGNQVKVASANLSGSRVLGYAEEDASAGGTGEVIIVRVDL